MQGTQIKINVGNYLFEISEILNRVPRQLLLILKTNDVLRGIETSLHTRASATSFINMSKCCIRAVAEEKRRHSKGCFNYFIKIYIVEKWQLLKITVYELYLWMSATPLFKLVTPLQAS